ncbi:hypothetical protein MED222_04990 [Vibrio sp. MED222]|nr:hypothetical protein MED222_04990 [Vibrio sp. MED222]
MLQWRVCKPSRITRKGHCKG